MGRFPYRRILLFTVALILPSVMIALLGLRNAAQQREIDAKRLEEERTTLREDTRREVRRQVLALLESIKSEALAAASRSPFPRINSYSHSAIKLIGWAEGTRLILPWEVNPDREQFQQAIVEKEFAFKAAMAERAELAEKDYSLAEFRYRELLASAEAEGNRSHETYVRYRLARTLMQSGRMDEALSLYRQLLVLPSSVVDEYGIPFTLWSAFSLSKPHRADREILDRMSLELDSATAVTPLWNKILGDVLEELKKSRDASVVRDAERAMRRLAERNGYLEQVQALQAEFPGLHVSASNWLPYGKDPWLVGMTTDAAEINPMVIAVRAESIFREIESASDSDLRFSLAAGTTAGEALGENLPGVRLTFRSTGYPAAQTATDVHTSPYLLPLPFIVGLTLLGGYLLWRDTRREVRMSEMRSQFVSSVSHELKTPLTSIRMFAETLQMNEASTPPETRAEYLDTIVNETERLTRLLNNVLDFSRIERGKKSYHLQPTPLEQVVDSAARAMRFPLTQQGFDLHVNICDGIPPVQADRDAIEQAILNLVNNAMKYSGKSRDIRLELCAQNGTAIIRVSDRGIGIPAAEQRRIFDRFYRVPTPENRAISGAGLGLPLVAHIVEAHNGKVEVESKPGDGSTFSIRLPLNGSHSS